MTHFIKIVKKHKNKSLSSSKTIFKILIDNWNFKLDQFRNEKQKQEIESENWKFYIPPSVITFRIYSIDKSAKKVGVLCLLTIIKSYDIIIKNV